MPEQADETNVGEPDADGAEETVVVDRPASADQTVVVDRAAMEERTVVVDRAALEEQTVVVDRAAVEERTVVVDRSPLEERTVVVDRGASEGRTVVVDRGAASAPRVAMLGTLPRRGRRVKVEPAPGGVWAQGIGVTAVGPGAVSRYLARSVPPPPPVRPPLSGQEATRTEASLMPSVGRQSRRVGRTVLLLVATACVVSAGGIVLVVIALIGG